MENSKLENEKNLAKAQFHWCCLITLCAALIGIVAIIVLFICNVQEILLKVVAFTTLVFVVTGLINAVNSDYYYRGLVNGAVFYKSDQSKIKNNSIDKNK